MMQLIQQVTLVFLWCLSSASYDIYGPKYPFQDVHLPWNERVDDLVGRLTLEEIAIQSHENPQIVTPGIPRLGISPYVWSTECMHGQCHTNTTAFPQSIGLAASFSGPLIYNVSRAISFEIRAHWNANVKRAIYRTNYGLSCFSPVINIMRHPLWGRNQETYGEDPYLSGALVQHYVRGLQGDHPRYVRVTAGCKHFDVHGGPEDIPTSRFSFNSKVTTRDWRMTFLPQFKMCVEAGTYNLMCSYNSINGIPACVNKKLLTDITRTEWGFKGHIVSDAGALDRVVTAHGYLPNVTVTAAAAIKAGCNQELSGTVLLHQVDAYKEGFLTEHEIRENIKPLFYTRMRLGLFDPPSMNPYNQINNSVIQSSEHRELAIQAALKTFVLMKNIHLLPLKPKYKKIAFVGPFANATDELFGDYTSDVVAKYTRNVFEGLRRLGREAVLSEGCSSPTCTQYNQTDMQKAITGSDLVVVCLGTGTPVEEEGRDRSTIDLPGQQLLLLKDAVASGKGAPVILLLFNAGPLDISWAKSSPDVTAIIECFFPGQSAGEALYRLITGVSVPAGRLPATWPTHTNQVPPITDYTMEGRTYRYYHGQPLYPFGYGLSYTSFKYQSLTIQPKVIQSGQDVRITCTVLNQGRYDAEEVIQIYISWHNVSIVLPKLQLAAFTRQMIKAGEQRMFLFTISTEQLSVWLDDDQGWGLLQGYISVYAGGQQPYQATAVPSNVLHDTFLVSNV